MVRYELLWERGGKFLDNCIRFGPGNVSRSRRRYRPVRQSFVRAEHGDSQVAQPPLPRSPRAESRAARNWCSTIRRRSATTTSGRCAAHAAKRPVASESGDLALSPRKFSVGIATAAWCRSTSSPRWTDRSSLAFRALGSGLVLEARKLLCRQESARHPMTKRVWGWLVHWHLSTQYAFSEIAYQRSLRNVPKRNGRWSCL